MNGLILAVLLFVAHPTAPCTSGGRPIIRLECVTPSAPAVPKTLRPIIR